MARKFYIASQNCIPSTVEEAEKLIIEKRAGGFNDLIEAKQYLNQTGQFNILLQKREKSDALHIELALWDSM